MGLCIKGRKLNLCLFQLANAVSKQEQGGNKWCWLHSSPWDACEEVTSPNKQQLLWLIHRPWEFAVNKAVNSSQGLIDQSQCSDTLHKLCVVPGAGGLLCNKCTSNQRCNQLLGPFRNALRANATNQIWFVYSSEGHRTEHVEPCSASGAHLLNTLWLQSERVFTFKALI